MINEQSILYKAGIFALIAIGLLALAAIWIMVSQNNRQNATTLPVEGRAEVSVVPNKATISTTFEMDGKDQAEAGNKLSTKLTEVVAALDKEGVKPEDRKTENLSVNPKYEQCIYDVYRPQPCPSEPKIIGYIASQSLTINFKMENGDKSKLEKVSGLLPGLGAKYTNGPNLIVDSKDATNQARAAAIVDARAKAEVTAKALGKTLGEMMYYSESNGDLPIPYMMSARAEVAGKAMDAAAPMPVELGTDKVSIVVNITYELK